jgi:YD repeat-containing protein
MIDERTLAATLRELSGDVIVPPDPATAVRRRAARIRRRRRAAGAALAMAVVAAGAVGVKGVRAPAPADSFAATERPTSQLLTVATVTVAGQDYRWVVYLHGAELCAAVLGVTNPQTSTCDRTPANPARPIGAPITSGTLIGRIDSPRITGVELSTSTEPGAYVGSVVTVPGTTRRAYVVTLQPGDRITEIVGVDASNRVVARRRVDVLGHSTKQTSAAVPITIPSERTDDAFQRVGFWTGRAFCTEIDRGDFLVSQQCSTGTDRVIPDLAFGFDGENGFPLGLLGTAEPGAVRVVARLGDGTRLPGTVADGPGFPLPLFAVVGPVDGTGVRWLQSYDAAGHLLGQHAPRFLPAGPASPSATTAPASPDGPR